MTIASENPSAASQGPKNSAAFSPSGALLVKPLEPTLAGEVTKLSLREPLDAQSVRAVRTALLERKVLVFRGQHLSPEELVRFARYFGEPFGSPERWGLKISIEGGDWRPN